MLDKERLDYNRDRNNWDLIRDSRTPMPRWKVIGSMLLIAACFLAVMWVEVPY